MHPAAGYGNIYKGGGEGKTGSARTRRGLPHRAYVRNPWTLHWSTTYGG